MKFFENDRGLISKLSTTNINFNVQQFYKDYIPHLSIYEHEMYAYKITNISSPYYYWFFNRQKSMANSSELLVQFKVIIFYKELTMGWIVSHK